MLILSHPKEWASNLFNLLFLNFLPLVFYSSKIVAFSKQTWTCVLWSSMLPLEALKGAHLLPLEAEALR